MYFGAGMFRISFPKFAVYCALAVAVWTPVLVYLSALLGAEAIESAFMHKMFLEDLILFFGGYFLVKFMIRISTRKGRRLFLGKLKRIRHWEFWPMTQIILPVIAYIVWLMFKYRSITVFTCANPSIEAGGFVGESKDDIYDGLRQTGENDEFLLNFKLISGELTSDEDCSSLINSLNICR